MTMTRHDFQEVARIFAVRYEQAPTAEARQEVIILARDMADIMAASNPRFDRSKFLAACWGGMQS